jgi:uncharacterized membrane-anchored protein YjiN (DUF445 family)
LDSVSRPTTLAEKEEELAAAKRRALFFLAVSAAIFVATLFLPASLAVQAIRACAEAAMVGGLADWFAVVALFRRIPTGLPFITNHTAVLPDNKDRIADNLAAFVKEQFLGPQALADLIRKHDPAARVADWLAEPRNADRLATHAVSFVDGALRLVDEEHVRGLLKDAVRRAVESVDLSRSAAQVVRSLTEGGRHQELLDDALAGLLDAIESPQSRQLIADALVRWFKAEHPLLGKGLPTGWLGSNAAEMLRRGIAGLLEDVHRNPRHDLRARFDAAVEGFAERLDQDPSFAEKGEEIKHYILGDAAFGAYVNGLWDTALAWLLDDLHRPSSILHGKVRESARWLGARIAGDPALRAALNDSLEASARSAAPDFADFLATHIRDTIRRWDATEMSRQVELNIGKDLQAIRMNGTVVGGAIGLVLFGISRLIERLSG